MERIGDIFKSYRNRQKITQKEFAIILGYSEATIKKIEAKNNNKNTGMVVAVIQYDCGHCRHCSLEISPDSKNKLKQGELVECESCHMLLVMEENK